jgi:hypothetical protein
MSVVHIEGKKSLRSIRSRNLLVACGAAFNTVLLPLLYAFALEWIGRFSITSWRNQSSAALRAYEG